MSGFSLKDQLFNEVTVRTLAVPFGAAGVFDADRFVARVVAAMPPLELKERINLIADELIGVLPNDFPDTVMAIRASLPPPLDPTRTDDDFGSFIYAPLGVVVEKHGIEDHLDLSLDLLEDLTQRFSMEFSIRAFLNRWPNETVKRMNAWAHHENYHVRRLASEGLRPKLPWGKSIPQTTSDRLPVLDALHADSTRFVTRSVANHLNDIAKREPDVVIDLLDNWISKGQQDRKELDWMRRHALRSLIKEGHSGAMAHLGYDAKIAIDAAEVTITPDTLAIGEKAEITASFTAPKGGPIIADYVIDFVKSNGSSAPKVFKMKVLQAKPDAEIVLKKAHLFKKGATTFTHYPGVHRISLQINGRIVASNQFVLS